MPFAEKKSTKAKGIRSLGSKVDKLYFCFAGDCSKNYFKQNNNNNQMKCDECGSVPSGDYWGFFIVDGKTYCDSCSKKIPKTPQKSELEREQEKLENLKDKYKNAFNQVEKDNLKKTIEETENHIKNLRANNNSTEQPTKNNLGKYLLGGSVILGGITLIFILVIRRRKKKNHN